MANNFFLAIFFTLLSNCSFAQKTNEKMIPNFMDSLQVNNFIKKSTTSQQIKFVERNKSIFIEPKSYSNLVLESISKTTGVVFFLPIMNGNMLSSKKQLENSLQEQLNVAKRKLRKRGSIPKR